MKVSVVIAAYNAEKTLAACLDGCLRQVPPAHEIIVVDDGSTDGTRELVEGFMKKSPSVTASGSSVDEPLAVPPPSREDLRGVEPNGAYGTYRTYRTDGKNRANLVDRSDQSHQSSHHSDDWPCPIRYLHQANAGPAAARNGGAARATGDAVAFTDSDCVPAPDWLEKLVAGFVDDSVAGVGGTYAIANPQSLLARMVHEEIVMRHERMGADVDFLGSFNVAYRKSAFGAAGGFDETFRAASGEDNDLAYRVQDRGGRLRFTRDAVVAHYHPQRLWPYLRTQYRHGYWRVKLYTKHRGRARGDRYAGLSEFVAPPLALVLLLVPVAVIMAVMLPAVAPALAALCAGLVLVYLALQGFKGMPMARRVGPPALVLFPGLLFLRDVARGLGLIRGVWVFVRMRKGVA